MTRPAPSPRRQGFRMPAEWEPHSRCWMAWPWRGDTWREKAKPAQEAFAVLARTIARFEPVTVCVSPERLPDAAALLGGAAALAPIATDDAWMRDTGPTFITGPGGLAGVDWRFNAWGGDSGGLYASWEQDAAAARRILERESIARFEAPLVLEGGSIHSDGQGTLLTTAECLLNPNRNPHLSRDEIEAYLKEFLGAEKVLWIPRGVVQDETSGHVDNLCCFTAPGHIVLTWPEDPADEQRQRSQEALDFLRGQTDARGRKLEIHKLPQPGPLCMTEDQARGVEPCPGSHPRRAGDRLAASYVNFYIANGAVIMASFGDPADGPAREILAGLFPRRAIVQVPGLELLLGGGNIHCLTQQQPAGPRPARTSQAPRGHRRNQ